MAILLLDDTHGIKADAYSLLSGMLKEDGGCADILKATDGADGRIFLPEKWNNEQPERETRKVKV